MVAAVVEASDTRDPRDRGTAQRCNDRVHGLCDERCGKAGMGQEREK